MAAILAKKLGMTQVFQEDGSVARVTVLQAGPCPVTAIRTSERDGYDAVQLAFGRPRRSTSPKPELGHLKKADAPPMRTLVEFRDEVGELTLGETVKVDAFEVGARVKISGTSKGKGFQGTIKRHNFASGPKSHGSHNVRAPGSIGASATPSRVLKGIRGPGQMGNKRVTQKGLEVVRVDAAENLLMVRGSVPGPPARSWRCAPMPDAPVLGAAAAKKVKLEDSAFGVALLGAAGAPERARRAGSTPARHRRHQNPRQGLRRWRQAVAPEGHRPRARRLEPLTDLDRRRHRLRSAAALVHVQGQPQGAARRAAQRAVAARRPRLDRDPRRERLHGAQDQPGAGAARRLDARRGRRRAAQPTLVVLVPEESAAALSFRNLARVAVLSAENVGVADLLGAAALVISEPALQALTARTGPPRKGDS